jgi:plastocyanin
MKNEFVILSAFFLFMLLSFVGAHETSGDVFVRVVSSDPASRTYTFSCSMDPENGYLRDWFIRPDSGTTDSLPEEAIILDKPAGEHLTYTFEENGFYHIGCVIVDESDFSKNYRGDLHIDLRNNEWDPEVVPVSGSGKSVTLMCDYSGDASGASWEVVDAKTGAVSSIGSGQTITHSVSGHGLYDYVCKVGGKGTGLPMSSLIRVIRISDEFGVPHGVKKVWLRGTQPPQNDSGMRHSLPRYRNLRTDTDGGLNAQFVCKPSGASDDLTVDWNFGDGQQVFDDVETLAIVFLQRGVFCTMWGVG